MPGDIDDHGEIACVGELGPVAACDFWAASANGVDTGVDASADALLAACIPAPSEVRACSVCWLAHSALCTELSTWAIGPTRVPSARAPRPMSTASTAMLATPSSSSRRSACCSSRSIARIIAESRPPSSASRTADTASPVLLTPHAAGRSCLQPKSPGSSALAGSSPVHSSSRVTAWAGACPTSAPALPASSLDCSSAVPSIASSSGGICSGSKSTT
mmetsp:Transcript_39953/g.80020  ORF Transcript_39953/g.80020 Transcript_39953/m.80020 type:complete len:218 (+) Transcript_39953:1638-2291(+)